MLEFGVCTICLLRVLKACVVVVPTVGGALQWLAFCLDSSDNRGG